MSYLGDIRENSFGPNGELWEGDNRIEERHYWNGAFIDLCNLSAEDYAKTIFVTSGSGSPDTPVTPSKVQNPITIKESTVTDENGNTYYVYQALAKQPVNSEVTVNMTIQDEFGAEEEVILTIPSGSSSSESYRTGMMMMSRPPKVVNSDHNPKEDEKFEYDTVLPEEKPILPMAYSITLKKGEIDTISDSELEQKLLANGNISMKNENTSEVFEVDFSKNSVPVDGFSNMSIPEMDKVLIENSQDIILVTDKPIKTIAEANTNFPETELWVKREKTITIDGVVYTVWFKRDEGQTAQSSVYDPITNEKVSAASAKYIIYYE